MVDRIDFEHLAQRLIDRAEQVVSDWLPGGKKQGKEWVCADFSGGPGRSLSINLHTGKWGEFNEGGETGNDLTSLYAAIHTLGNAEAARELIDRYGFTDCLTAVQTSVRPERAQPSSARPEPARREPAAAPPAPAAGSGGQGKRKTTFRPIVPVPANAPPVRIAHYHYTQLDGSWEYRFNGDLYGYISRWRDSDGGKQIVPHTWCVDEGDLRGTMKWHSMQWPEPRPLYVPAGQLAEDLDRWIVLVEGEKCALAGHELLGDEFDWVSWPGGSNAWQKAGWSWLAGRKVILWPDADSKREKINRTALELIKADAIRQVEALGGEITDADRRNIAETAVALVASQKPLLPADRQPGMKAMIGIGEILQAQQGCIVTLCPIPKPGNAPDGWDVADAIAGGWGPEEVRNFLRGAKDFVSVNPEQRAAAADPRAPAGAGQLEGSAGWRAKLIYAGESIAKVRDNLVLALDGISQGEGRPHLAGVPEAAGVIAFNQFSNNVIKLKPAPWGTPGGEWLEHDELEMGSWLTREHFLPSMPRATLEESVQMVARRHSYHPVRAKLDGLRGKWDKQKRLNSWLKRCVAGDGADLPEDERERRDQYLSRVGTWLLMAMVARVLHPGCKFDYMVIFEGAQGVGKSTLAQLLGGEWFADTGLQLGEKDSYQNLQGIWVYEWGELDSLSRSEVTKVKQFISSQKDRFRASFDRRPRDYPRQCVFIGTTNEDHYLTDPTGNRRMWPVLVALRVDIPTVRAELDQMLAEALTYVEAGERFHPTPREQRELFDPQQQERTVENAIEVEITRYLYDPQQRVPMDGHKGTAVNEITLIALLGRIGIGLEKLTPGRFHEKQAGAALRKLGWVEGRSSAAGRPRVYRRPSPDPLLQTGGQQAIKQSPTQGSSNEEPDGSPY